MFGKLKYGQIQYIICVSLNSWMSLFVMTSISYLSSSLEDVAFSTSSLLKTINNTPFINFSFPRALFYTSNLFFLWKEKD